MASEVMRLTAQIVMSHASMTELTPAQLMEEIKEIYGCLASLEGKIVAPEPKPQKTRPRQPRKAKVKMSPEAVSVRNLEGSEPGEPDYQDFMEHREG